MPVPLPPSTTPQAYPPLRRRHREAVAPVPAVSLPRQAQASTPSSSAVSLPRQAQSAVAPIPAVSLPGSPGQPEGKNGAAAFSPATGGKDQLGRMVSLLEEIARGPSRQSGLEASASQPPDGPVQETGWRTLFNGEPLGEDGAGNAVLRRR